jgi:hypothetical protein
MDPREREILANLLARANPPPVLHCYRRPNEWALAEIGKQQIFATSPDDLNDPFEAPPLDSSSASSAIKHFPEICKNKLDGVPAPHIKKRNRLRHPTFQRISHLRPGLDLRWDTA